MGEIIVRDISQDNPSPSGQQLLMNNQRLRYAVEQRNIDLVTQLLRNVFRQQNFNYNLPEEIFREIIEEGLIPISFYCPLQIFNSGRKHCHLSNLILILKSTGNPDHKWALSAMMEFDAQKIIDFKSIENDADRFSRVFSGVTIAPLSGERTDPLFVPVNGKEISTPDVPPTFGKYLFNIYGYDKVSNKALEVGPEKIDIDVSHYQEAFKGVDTLQLIGDAKNVDKALKEDD